MKSLLLFTVIIFSICTFAQTPSKMKEQLLMNKAIVDCEIVTHNAINLITNHLQNNLYDSTDSLELILREWEKMCGTSEGLLRVRILNKIILQQTDSLSQDIETYINKYFDYHYERRVLAAQEVDFGVIYNNYKGSFNYIPLRHSFDSTTLIISKRLLQSVKNENERIICLLFSNQFDSFRKEIRKTENILFHRKDRKQNAIVSICVGTWSDLKKTDYNFGTDPFFRLSVDEAISKNKKLSYGGAFSVRFNTYRTSFSYHSKDTVYNITNEATILMGLKLNYTLFEHKKWKVISTLGSNVEIMFTDFSDYQNDDEQESDGFEFLNLYTGISISHKISANNTLGLNTSFSYTPYNLKSNFVSQLSQQSISTGLFITFR